jgi:hypothetical protein
LKTLMVCSHSLVRPTEMMKGFDNPDIEPIAREVEGVIFQMMRDAASTGTETLESR